MKKILLGFILLFLLTLNVNAENIIHAYDLEKGNIYSNTEIMSGSIDSYESIVGDLIHIVYQDKDGNLLEAFTATRGTEFTFCDDDNIYNYSTDMYIHGNIIFNFGNTCKQAYGNTSSEHIEWCDKYLSMYSSGKNLSNIKYWQVESIDEIRLSEFCASTPEVQLSFACTDALKPNKVHFNCAGGYVEEVYDSFPVVIFKEYAPANFKLECDPKEVKKGETSNCQLKIETEESISEITINKDLNNEPFSIKEINGVDGWEIIENNNGIITLINENGFEGEGIVFNTTIKFKEDFIDTANIELNSIDYITTNGYEFNSSAKENIKVYEEIKNPETSNQFIGVLCLLGIIIFTNISIHYINRKNKEVK